MYWHTKIQRYGLGDLVSQLSAEGKTFTQIANACNENLSVRPDHDSYVEIAPQNVKVYLEGLARDNDRLRENIDLQKQSLEIDEVVKEIRGLCSKTRDKLNQAYEKDDTNSYARLHTALLEGLKTLATIEGKLKNYVTLELFNAHILKIVKVIVDDQELSARDKRRVVSKIKDEASVIAEALQPNPMNLMDGTTPNLDEPEQTS